MKTQHTPGPWHLQSIGSELYVEAFGPVMICDMQKNEAFNPLEVSTLEANSRLIAAAPDLLEALKACVERMAELQKHTNYPLAWPRVMAAAAIAKAEGKV